MSSTGQRLGQIVLARRTELDLSQMDVWQAGGPSNTTLTEVENGRLERLTRTTAKRLDTGLKWEPGSARTVWDGGDPTPLLKGIPPKYSARLRRIIEESDEIDEGKRDALLRVLDGA